MKVCLGIPAQSGLDSDVVVSLINNIVYLSQKHSVTLITDKNIPLDHSRNLIVKETLNQKCDALIFLDSDIILVNDNFEKVADALDILVGDLQKHPAVTGLYYLKTSFLNIFDINEKDNFPYLTFYKETVPDYVDGCGLGIFAVKTSVIEKLTFPWFKWIIDHPSGGLIGEDVYFSWQLKKLGVRIKVEKKVWGLHMIKGWASKDFKIIVSR